VALQYVPAAAAVMVVLRVAIGPTSSPPTTLHALPAMMWLLSYHGAISDVASYWTAQIAAVAAIPRKARTPFASPHCPMLGPLFLLLICATGAATHQPSKRKVREWWVKPHP